MSKKDERQKDKIVIEFSEELLRQWEKQYFKKHPRARKKPIDTPAQPSLNKWIILRVDKYGISKYIKRAK